MRKLIVTALTAMTLVPVAAQAQSNGELRHDRRDIRQEQRDLSQARRTGDRHDIRDERRDVRDARREYREDRNDRDRRWARDDWRGWRDRNPAFYARGSWRAPFRYYNFRPGLRIGAAYYGPSYRIADPWRFHLPAPAGGQVWVRHYDDVILVDTRRGVVIDVIRGFYR
ncbi:MAG: RcnB family protein [Pseudomonadota bacterium]|nr:RcnB family protein [Pseudomonadota bacterium]